jgi:MATE family multidrug resistance protein
MNFLFSKIFPPKDDFKSITKLALPIIAGMISQNILNLVDTAMVGHLGDDALAALGIGGFGAFLSLSLLFGLSTGVQAQAARRIGEGRSTESALPLNGSLFLIALFSPLWSLLLYQLVPLFFSITEVGPAVQKLGGEYLEIRIIGLIFVALNFSFRGQWNAVKATHVYFKILLVIHLANVVLNYGFIFGKFGLPEMGVQGAAYGTVYATALGTLLHFAQGKRYLHAKGFLQKLPRRQDLKTLVKVSLPTSIQQLFFSAGFTAMFALIGRVGTQELAAAHVLVAIILVAILPGIGFGLAAATLVGQSLGAKNYQQAKYWGHQVLKVGLLFFALVCLPLVATPELLLSFFIHDPETLSMAVLPLRLSGVFLFTDAYGLILMHAMLGAGHTQPVMKISIASQWLFFIPLLAWVGPVKQGSLLAMWGLYLIYRAVQALFFGHQWKTDRWMQAKV